MVREGKPACRAIRVGREERCKRAGVLPDGWSAVRVKRRFRSRSGRSYRRVFAGEQLHEQQNRVHAGECAARGSGFGGTGRAVPVRGRQPPILRSCGNRKRCLTRSSAAAFDAFQVLVATGIAFGDRRPRVVGAGAVLAGFRERPERAEKLDHFLGRAAFGGAEIPAGDGRQRHGDFGEADAAEIDPVGVDLRDEQRIRAVRRPAAPW